MPAPGLPSTSELKALGLKSIVDSIMMEASEKCEEIEVKCDEEYQVLRRKEISEQGEIIERAEKKRRAQLLRDDRVYYTKLINNSRLAQLKARNDIYNEILKTVKQRVSRDTSNKYKQLLENSLIQAMYMLMEPEVYITCRKKDQNLVSATFPSAAQIYEKNTRLRVTIGFSDKSLPDNSSSGGLLVSARKETISVNCSLESRVDYVCHLAMPMIVETLFKGHTAMKETPKMRKVISPVNTNQLRLEEQSIKPDHSESPEPTALLEERLGVGSSTINILSPPEVTISRKMPDDHRSQENENTSRHSEDEQNISTGKRSPATSSLPRDQDPDPDTKSPTESHSKSSSKSSRSASDANRESNTKSPSSNEQGPSSGSKN